MGLLDLMNRPGARQGLGLLAAAGPSPVPMSFGQRAMGLLGQMDAEKRAEEERQAQAQMRALQQQLLQAQLGERQDMAADRRTQRDQAALDQQLLRQRFTPMDGPMPDGGPLMPRVDPADFIAQGGSLGGVQNLMALNSAMQPQRPKPMVLKPGEAVFDETGRRMFDNPEAPKPEKAPTAVQEYEFARQQGYKGSFLDFQLAQRRAGATNVNLSTGDRVPQGVVKQQDEILDRLTTAKSTDADLAGVAKQLESGTLQFGPIRNLVNTGKNLAGISDEESRAFATFKSTLEKLRNDSLKLNTGVQTDGDAQRAWNELFQNINDTEFVKQRLQEIRRINQRAAQLQSYRLNVLRDNFGARPLQMPEIPGAIQPEGAPNQSGVRRYNPETGKIE
jgi:hypothetical protein